MSTINTSSWPHSTCVSNCCNAPISMGPRQMTASSFFSISPMEIMRTPCASGGMMRLPSGDDGRFRCPSSWAGLARRYRHPAGPRAAPWRAKATARLAATVDLPTPPLPDPIAIRFVTPGTGWRPSCGVGWRPTFSLGSGFGGVCDVSATAADWTPSAVTTRSACARTSEYVLAISAEGVSMTKRTDWPSTTKARTRSRAIRVPPSGKETVY